ncbi:hypothetical protein PT2222_100150 [Paraburkholderia tropica]
MSRRSSARVTPYSGKTVMTSNSAEPTSSYRYIDGNSFCGACVRPARTSAAKVEGGPGCGVGRDAGSDMRAPVALDGGWRGRGDGVASMRGGRWAVPKRDLRSSPSSRAIHGLNWRFRCLGRVSIGRARRYGAAGGRLECRLADRRERRIRPLLNQYNIQMTTLFPASAASHRRAAALASPAAVLADSAFSRRSTCR